MKKLLLILLLASCSNKSETKGIKLNIASATTAKNFGLMLLSDSATILSIQTDSLGNYDYSTLIVTDSLAAIKMFLDMAETRNKEIMEKLKLNPVYKEGVIEL